MRLIDADALIEKCGGWYVDECTESGFIGTLENLLATEPTIQPEKEQLSKEGITSDLISRQAAIDALMNNVTPYGLIDDDGNIESGCKDKDVVEMLYNLPSAQPEPQWIPVSERLPEKSANYLVTVRWYREDDIDINVYEYNAWHKEWNDGESCGQRVIAWMPLPEAYKPNK